MKAIFYNFSKRENSLSAPSGEGYEKEISLKDGCTILDPEIELSGSVDLKWNYIHIPAFDRFYFITNWTAYRGIWTCSATVDALSTWAQYIRGTTAHVLFSSSKYNSHLMDTRIAAGGNLTQNSIDYDFVGTMSGQESGPDGYFVLTTLAQESQWATGTATQYFMTYQQMQNFARNMLAPDFLEQLKQFFNNPFDCLIDCYYLPIRASLYTNLSTDGPVYLGSYEVPGTTAKKPLVTSLAIKSKDILMDIPWVYDDFRRLPPYTNIDLFVPFCGTKSIDPAEVYHRPQLRMTYSVDLNSGSVQAVASQNKVVLQEWNGNCKVSLPISQNQSRVDSIIGGLGGAITAVAGFGSGNVALGATGVLSAAANVFTPMQVKTMGGFSGSILGAILDNATTQYQNFRITVTSRETSDEPANLTNTVGRMCNAVASIGSLSGFCQTSQFSVSGPMTDRERKAINAYMDGGVYL